MMKFFDRLEDYVRGYLSKRPITYSIIGGVGVVLFWRSVWETADILMRLDNKILNIIFYPPVQIIFSTIILLITGVMVSVFIGDRIILSGLRHEKKLEEKTEELVEEEVVTLSEIHRNIRKLEKEVKDLSK